MRSFLLVLATLSLCAQSHAATLSGRPLIEALRHGGYVILMRHASSPGDLPDAAHADPGNLRHERQLDEAGRAAARAMGEALHHLGIPVAQVLSSPTYRALETARLAQPGEPRALDELGDAGQSMSRDASGARGAWLRMKVAERPKSGTDILIVTHYPNITEAFPSEARDLADGEALIFRPDGRGAAALVARVRIEQWPALAASDPSR